MTNHISKQASQISYESVDICPICKASITPSFVAASLNTVETASVFNYCPHCYETFITQYKIELTSPAKQGNKPSVYTAKELLYSEPNRYSKVEFDDEIKELSPEFDVIYNQALQAECAGLDRIAGMGYRKAAEFLIKDYAIHIVPNAADEIKELPLSACIKKYIDDTRLVTLAERVAWLGNDEAHYVRKHADYNVEDMKIFIEAFLHFTSMVLAVEKAESIKKA